jgi:hypothetical protein
MTYYPTSKQSQSPISAAAQAAKAKRQAVLERVRAQRAHVHKRTVAEWTEAGVIIRGSELKERYQNILANSAK